MKKYLYLIICVFLCFSQMGNARKQAPKDAFRDSVMLHIFNYASQLQPFPANFDTTYTYTKYQMRTNHRNLTLKMIPTMYAISRGVGRHFFGEYYSKMFVNDDKELESKRLITVSTIPRRKNAMSSILNYLTPNVYNESLFQDNILSPYFFANRKFYNYTVSVLPFGKAQVYAYPKTKNTQLVRSIAIVDAQSGRINLVDFEGEYDMTRFYITVVMNKTNDEKSLYPKQCDLRANFRFLGNQITGMYTSVYGLPKMLPYSLDNVEDTAIMAKVRPVPLTRQESELVENHLKKRFELDSLSRKGQTKKSFAKDVLWDMVGDNVLNRIKQNFGKQHQGYFRINPILNPLYMGYSDRKGFVYKYDLRGSYTFNENIQLALRIKGGYSFKQHQFYFKIPLTLNYNKKHDGFLQVEIGNGNRINSNVVAKKILADNGKQDSSLLSIPYELYSDFKDNYFRLTNRWMFTPQFGFEIGMVAHHRQAVHPEFYESYFSPTSYRSVAPTLSLRWHPMKDKGPVVVLDYERSFKKFMGSNIDYERVEMDVQGIINATRRRSVSLRGGTGFYTKKGDHWYFVDYTNFKDNNIPGGWNDEWSGEFELLRSAWYNTSDYYVRTNATFESPTLFAAWMPWVGRFIEKERLYVNTLFVKQLHPYTEWGYGFTTRLMSLGIFAAFKNKDFEGVGCKFGFELFRNW